MKAKILVTVFVFSGLASCNSQDLYKGKNKQTELKKPHEEFHVNRTYDENENLIEFDSTYTSYYSTFEGDTIAMDSIMSQFPMFFNQRFNYDFPEHLSEIDSSFFHDNFFERQFFTLDEELWQLMRQMDSIKNEFFKDYENRGF